MVSQPHPVRSELFRRVMYLVCAGLFTLAWYGAGQLTHVDAVAPLLFAAAAGFSLAGAARTASLNVWYMSGAAATMAAAWRAGQIFALEQGWVYQEPPDSSHLAFAVYAFSACFGVPAVWLHWLRPRAVL